MQLHLSTPATSRTLLCSDLIAQVPGSSISNLENKTLTPDLILNDNGVNDSPSGPHPLSGYKGNLLLAPVFPLLCASLLEVVRATASGALLSRLGLLGSVRHRSALSLKVARFLTRAASHGGFIRATPPCQHSCHF